MGRSYTALRLCGRLACVNACCRPRKGASPPLLVYGFGDPLNCAPKQAWSAHAHIALQLLLVEAI